MSNEELVNEIRNGFFVSDNLQLLYENNLPLIKKFIKPYAAYDSMDDVLQESFFGLIEATKHYESDKNVLFSTYMQYWIKQSVIRYLENCASAVRIPSHTRAKMTKYRRAIQRLEQEQGGEPTAADVAAIMGVSEKEVQELQVYAQGVASLDTPLTDDSSFTLSDTLQADFSLENDTVDKIYNEHSKNELWGIVEHYTSIKENEVIKEYFINQKTMSQIARESGLSLNRIRQIKEKGIRRLRISKAKRELLEKFDIADSALYRGGLNNYKEHDFVSIVEHTAIKRIGAEERYKKHLAEIEERHEKRMSGNCAE